MLLLLARLAHAEDLYVSSNVKGAEIFLNGVATGKVTPATLTGVAPGTVEVTVEAGCAKGSATVTVQKGVPNRVGLVAMAEDATITVNPDPVQARLFLDDQPYPGRVGAPLAVECGDHVVRAELDGYVAASLAIELGGGEDRELTIELEEVALATIDLSVQPRDATLTLDGKPVGTDAASLPSVAVGGHIFGAEYEGYKTAAIEVVVNEGEEQAWHFSLAGENGKKESTATQLRGPRPGLVVDASGPNAAKVAASSSSSTATTSSATKSSSSEDLDEPAPTTSSKSSSSKTTASKSTASEDLDEPAPTASTSTSSKSTSSKSTSSKTTETAEKSSKSSGGDYYSRLRSGEEDGAAEVEETSTPAKSTSSSSTSSKSTTSSTSSKSTTSSSSASTSSGSTGSSSKSSTTSKSTETASDDVPSRYEDLDEPASSSASKKSSKDDKSEKSSKDDEKSAKADKGDGKSKVGLDVTGVTMLVLGAGSGAGAVYYWDRTTVAYDAYSAKVDAADASNDKALEKAASDYYDNVLVPKRNMMYATAAGAGVLGVTGLVLVLVDDHLPLIAPLPQGGAMLSWGTRF